LNSLQTVVDFLGVESKFNLNLVFLLIKFGQLLV
jgi:hypothetical protein